MPTQLTQRQANARYRALLAKATPGQIEEATEWYPERAGAIVEEIRENLGTSREVAASILSAFSPNTSWSENVKRALAFSRGDYTPHMYATPEKLNQILTDAWDALPGAKTNNFSRAMSGDDNAVVIDIWMMRAARMTREVPTARDYRILSAAVHKVASETGLTPRTAQALIWIVKRGNAA